MYSPTIHEDLLLKPEPANYTSQLILNPNSMDLTPTKHLLSDSSSEEGTGNETSPRYKRVQKKTCPEDWITRELRCIFDVEKVEVVIIDPTDRVSFEPLKKSLVKDINMSEVVGLTVIDEFRERRREAIAVCLTTSDKIYVFQPNIEPHAVFLRRIIERPNNNVKFFTRDGTWDADLLYRKIMIDLRQKSNHFDLIALDIHITLAKYLVEQNERISNYTMTYVHDQIKPKFCTFPELITKWLDVKLDLELNQDELEAIRLKPDQSLAINAIKKQAVLVREVANTMLTALKDLRNQSSKNIFAFAKFAPDDVMEDYSRRDGQSYSVLVSTLDQCSNSSEMI